MFLKSLSGRFLILTTVFVLLAEVLIFVSAVSRVRSEYLLSRLESAQIAALALLANDMIDANLEHELLKTAGVFNVVLRRDEVRQLVLSSPIQSPIYATYDMREIQPWEQIRDAMLDLWVTDNRVIRVIGNPVNQAGLLIEVTLETAPLRRQMIEEGGRILILSAVISIVTALLLFFAFRRFFVGPISGVVDAITTYAEAPEDSRRIIKPSAGVTELREAEEALASLQTQLTGALRQKERLAQLGGAVARVNHDLRNILTTAQLFTDRMEQSADPSVRRTVPKLLNSISRAVNLCETTLAFGKAEEAPPMLTRFPLASIVNDVVDSERLAAGEHDLSFSEDVPGALMIRADSEQLYRVIANLVRNARQAIVATGKPGEIQIRASETEGEWDIVVTDTGPGLPERAREHLFQPFQGGVRKDGFGLGLAIAAELVRGHGGRLELAETGPGGTTFAIRLPKTLAQLDAAAE